jgi:hypothetical protein
MTQNYAPDDMKATRKLLFMGIFYWGRDLTLAITSLKVVERKSGINN